MQKSFEFVAQFVVVAAATAVVVAAVVALAVAQLISAFPRQLQLQFGN